MLFDFDDLVLAGSGPLFDFDNAQAGVGGGGGGGGTGSATARRRRRAVAAWLTIAFLLVTACG